MTVHVQDCKLKVFTWNSPTINFSQHVCTCTCTHKTVKKTHPFNLSMNIHFVNNVTEILCQIAISKKEKKRKTSVRFANLSTESKMFPWWESSRKQICTALAKFQQPNPKLKLINGGYTKLVYPEVPPNNMSLSSQKSRFQNPKAVVTAPELTAQALNLDI